MTPLIKLRKTQPLKFPNLPQNDVALVAISAEANRTIKCLNNLGIKTELIQPSVVLSKGTASHADLRLLNICSGECFLQEHSFKSDELEIFNAKKITDKLEGEYPYDVRLNACIIGKYIIANEKTISIEVLQKAYEFGLELINVNQGYTKCSIAVLSENAIISDDIGICKSAQNFLNDVTYVSKKSIELKGYNYGFIGGCCGKIAKSKIAFNGEIDSHSEHNLIIDALSRNNIEAVELKTGRLTDIGGIIPLLEYIE